MTRFRTALAVVCMLSLAAPAFAAEVRGVVSKVDPEKNLLVVDARGAGVRGQTMTFVLAPDARVQSADEPARLGDLKAGRRVRVTYEARDGRLVATSASSPNLLGLVEKLAPTISKVVPVPAAPKPTPVADGPNTVRGELRRVALTDRELVVVGPGGETILIVPEEITVTKAGQPARFEDLKEGEQAAVRFEERAGRRVAVAVQVGEGAAAAPEETSVQRLRRALKMVDTLLDLADKSKMFDR